MRVQGETNSTNIEHFTEGLLTSHVDELIEALLNWDEVDPVVGFSFAYYRECRRSYSRDNDAYSGQPFVFKGPP